MKTILAGTLLLFALPALAAEEVSCDKGVDIARVQALVERAAAALKKDQATVVREINSGSPKWKDGSYYVVVVQGTRILAHGYLPTAAGMDAAKPPYDRMYPFVKAMEGVITQKGAGCVQYDFMNPAKGGQVEHKVTYAMKVGGTLWAASGTYLLRK